MTDSTAVEQLRRELEEARSELERLKAGSAERELADLRASRERAEGQLDRLFTMSLDMICIAGTDGRFKRINPAFEETLGYPADKLLAVPFLEFVHPDDIPKTLAEVEKLAGGQPTIAFENRYRCADGTYRWFAWKSAPAEDGTLYAMARDVTEQRQAAHALRSREAKLRAVFQSAFDGMFSADARGTILSMNQAAARLFDVEEGECLGQPVASLLTDSDGADLRARLVRYADRGDRGLLEVVREVRGRRRDTSFPVELVVTEVNLGDVNELLVIARDITQRKKDESMRMSMLAHDAVQRGRIEMASGILHDLGNALTGIGTNASTLDNITQQEREIVQLQRLVAFLTKQKPALGDALGPPRATALIELVDTLRESAEGERERVRQVLRKLLAFVSHSQELLATHRMYSGAHSAPQRERLGVERLLLDAQVMMADAASKRNGTILIEVEEGLPPIEVERSRIMQVLINLIKNSAEAFDVYAPPAPEIVLRASRSHGTTVVEVRDNGPGFESGLAETLFQDGYTTKGRSSGVGLAAARRVVKAIGGTLTLASAGPNKGATARIHIESHRGQQ